MERINIRKELVFLIFMIFRCLIYNRFLINVYWIVPNWTAYRICMLKFFCTSLILFPLFAVVKIWLEFSIYQTFCPVLQLSLASLPIFHNKHPKTSQVSFNLYEKKKEEKKTLSLFQFWFFSLPFVDTVVLEVMLPQTWLRWSRDLAD